MPIATAIRNRQLLSFTYDGHARVVEPHLLGRDNKGHQALRAFQVMGGSTSGNPSGWRLFHTSRMGNLSALPQTFPGPRAGYNPQDKAFALVDECL